MVSEPQSISHAVRGGRPTDHLPQLSRDDVVYTAGAPAMTESVAEIASAAGARCYTDPFLPDGEVSEPTTLMTRMSGWFGETRSNPIPLQPAQKEYAERPLAGTARANR
jgi:3-phenylpropionate/trans-cinnamate dioxygenase ferredoxin reductase subunit